MCGIAGMFSSPDESVIRKMVKILEHRGPDGFGIWVDESIGLGHSRLSIVDLAGSKQPICSNSGTVLIANGEVYNHLAIRKRVDYNWKTAGDSEVILALHDQHKAKISNFGYSNHSEWIKQLNGMFSFALWDSLEQELILARDAMGIKPLVRTKIDGNLMFASEIKAFHAHDSYQPVIDETALALRLAWEYSLDSSTLINNVHQVRPGTVEVWRLNEDNVPYLHSVTSFERQCLTPVEHWDPNFESKNLLESFTYSVQERLMADVPVGIVLSGGLDSSLVAAVASEAAEREGKPVPACWTVAESEDNPDWIAAEQVSSVLDLQHHCKVMQPDVFIKDIPKLAYHGEDLDISVLFFQPLFNEMQNHVKVGLCGQGADELHAGYPRYKSLLKHKQIVQSRLNLVHDSISQPIINRNLPAHSCWYSNSLLPDDYTNNLEQFLNFELERGQLSNFQLRLVDRHSMANSLEVRVPFLGNQHRLQSYRLPAKWRLPSTGLEKAALRHAASLTKLPSEIIKRPKLPAGTATSPNQLNKFLEDFSHLAKGIGKKYTRFEKLLKQQPDMALGLGLFEAVNIIQPLHKTNNYSIESLIEEVVP